MGMLAPPGTCCATSRPSPGETMRRDATIDELRDPLNRPTEELMWGICEEPGCRARVRFEYRCFEHLDPKVSTVKFCQATDCWDTLHHRNPQAFCGLHEHLGAEHEIWWDVAEAPA